MTTILVCGGRDYANYSFVCETLDSAREHYGNVVIVQGGARGADRLAKAWAVARGIPCVEIAANWDFYGKRAGSLRNQWMFDIMKPSVCVAFPGGVGTANMVSICEKAGIFVKKL